MSSRLPSRLRPHRRTGLLPTLLPTLLPILLLFAPGGMSGCVTTTRQTQAAARTNLGAAYLREGNAPAALQVLGEAVHKDPRNWEAWDHLGLAYWASGDFGKSEEAFEHGVKLVPDKAEIHNNYGLMLMAQGRNADAIVHFEVARKDLLYRRPPVVLTNLGSALYQEGRYDDALQVLDLAVQRAPDNCNAWFTRSLLFQTMDRNDAALTGFEQVIHICGTDNPGAYSHAGSLLIARGDREAGCTYLGTALDKAPAGSDLSESVRKTRALECP